MNIKYYYYTKYHKDSDGFYPYKSDTKKHITTFYAIHYLLLEDYEYFIKNNLINLEELHDPETDHTVVINNNVYTLNPTTKFIYRTSEYEECNYFSKNFPPGHIDRSPTIELILQDKITFVKISEKNFIELLDNWQKINLLKPPFALIWQDENDWIYAKAFGCEEDMDAFIKKHYKDDES